MFGRPVHDRPIHVRAVSLRPVQRSLTIHGAIAADAEGNANVKSRHLHALSKGLGVPVRVLLKPLPGLDPEQRERWRVRLLWDRLYPDLGG